MRDGDEWRLEQVHTLTHTLFYITKTLNNRKRLEKTRLVYKTFDFSFIAVFICLFVCLCATGGGLPGDDQQCAGYGEPVRPPLREGHRQWRPLGSLQ